MELVTEGKNFRLVQEDELPDVLDYLSEHLPESLKFHQTIKTYLHDRVWEFHFYASKSWPEDPIILHFPGITSLVCSALTKSSAMVCHICRAKISEMNNLSEIGKKRADPNTYRFGLSTLHCYIRFFECILHIAYRLPFKRWRPGGRLYDSLSVFCPVSRLDSLQLLAEEDRLVDWSRPLFLNFTHSSIVERIEEYCDHRLGVVEKIRGDIYVSERGLARGRQERRRRQRRNRAPETGGGGSAERRRKATASTAPAPGGDECTTTTTDGVAEAAGPACLPGAGEQEDEGAEGRGESGGGQEAGHGGGGGGCGGGGEATTDDDEDAQAAVKDGGGGAEEEEGDALMDEAQLRQLEPEHAVAIHSLYPANDMESVEVFERLIRALPAFGVFSPEGELAAWMVQSYYGAMFSMQTLPAFRRRGYGLLLARRLTSAVLARGYIPFVVIRPENSASQSLYAKLGFRRRYETVRAILRPKGWGQGGGDEAVVPEAAAEEEELSEAEVPEQGRAKAPKGPPPADLLREAEVPEVGGGD